MMERALAFLFIYRIVLRASKFHGMATMIPEMSERDRLRERIRAPRRARPGYRLFRFVSLGSSYGL